MALNDSNHARDFRRAYYQLFLAVCGKLENGMGTK